MPWRGPAEPKEFPTLGYLVAEFIEAMCAIPDGDRQGDPYRLTDEMLRFVLRYYRIDPDSGRFHYARGGQLVRPQKWGKGPFSAALICAEADGPVIFDGWNAAGDPVGRPWSTPWIQVTAVSEDQTANVWRALVPMIEYGSLRADLDDTGETRINLPHGGKIEPVTSAARSRLGQRITFAVQDETHSWWPSNGGRALADNQRRNLAGMNGRWMETTNAWDPSKESVAQATNEKPGALVLVDDVDPGTGSVRNRRERFKMYKRVYGDAWWVDLERIDGEVVALIDQGDAAQAERYFLNRKLAAESAVFDPDRWELLAKPDLTIGKGELVVVGVDGARFHDALAVVVTDVITGHQWPAGIWERPDGAPDEYEHPADEIDGAMSELFETFDVWRVYVDPQHIDHLMSAWAGRWNRHADREKHRVMPWWTNRHTQMAHAVRAYMAAFTAGDVSHDADPLFARHMGNARRLDVAAKDDKGRTMHVIQKEFPASPHKVDASIAAVLSWRARLDAIALGAKKRAGLGAHGAVW